MKKIFVSQRGSLGDTLLATPTLRAIKETYPDSKTIVLASPSSREILENHPFVDALIIYNKGDSVFPIIKKIWRSDVALLIDVRYRSSLFAWLAGIPKRIGRGNKKKSFVTDQIAPPDNDTYEVENTLALARYVGIDTKDFSLVMSPATEMEKEHVHLLLREQGVIENEKIVVIAPYSLSDMKDWPEEYYQQVVDFLTDRKFKLVIVGGKEHHERAQKFQNAINLCGRTGIRETTYLISLADLVICGCTSVLHFAATTKTPQIAIYGPTTPVQWAPRKNCTAITKNLPCSPCYHKGQECQNNKSCVRSIKPEEVLLTISKILEL